MNWKVVIYLVVRKEGIDLVVKKEGYRRENEIRCIKMM